MNYSPSGSGSQTSDVDNILEDHFGYDNDAWFDDYSNYTGLFGGGQDAFETMIQAELDLGRPLVYRGRRTCGTSTCGHVMFMKLLVLQRRFI